MGLNNNPSQPAYLIPGLPSAMGATKVVSTDASGNLVSYSVSGTGTTVALTASPVFTTDITVNGARVGLGNSSLTTNVAFGAGALTNISTGQYNVGIGRNALTNVTTGQYNVVIGDGGLANTNGSVNNVAIGANVLNQTSTGSSNNCIGYGSGFWMTTGAGNIGIGISAINGTPAGITGSYNTAIGYGAMSGVTSGGNNTCIGAYASVGAGSAITTGNYNVIIGSATGSAAPISATGSNNIVFSDGQQNTRGYFDNTGVLTVVNLAGAGSRAVNADANGKLSAASDARLKQEVLDAKIPGLEEVLQLRPVAYKWLDDIALRGEKAAIEIGFFANEAAPIIPSAAPMGSDGMYGFYDRSVIAALTKALQDLNAKFEAYVAAHP